MRIIEITAVVIVSPDGGRSLIKLGQTLTHFDGSKSNVIAFIGAPDQRNRISYESDRGFIYHVWPEPRSSVTYETRIKGSKT